VVAVFHCVLQQLARGGGPVERGGEGGGEARVRVGREGGREGGRKNRGEAFTTRVLQY